MSHIRLRMIYLVLIVFVCQVPYITSKNIESSHNNGNRDEPVKTPDPANNNREQSLNASTLALANASSTDVDIKLVPQKPANATSPVENVTKLTGLNTLKHMSMNSGAMLRGFYLLLGLSVLLILYFAFKAFRLRKTRAERKYGILRQDSDNQELTPLPLGLAEEESDGEDQTVFELHRTTDHV